MIKKIIILGTGGNSIDIFDTINDINCHYNKNIYQCIGFLDDNPDKWGKIIFDKKILGPLESALDYQGCLFVNGIGNPSNFLEKPKIIQQTLLSIDKFESIIHPTASVSTLSNIGCGTVIFQNVTITSNVYIGNNVIILPNTVISHDDIIGDYTCITGGVCISGGVEIGMSCYIGTNASVIGNIKIGNYCLVGMGSVVLHDIPENMVVAGNPARVLRSGIEQ